MTLPHVSVLAMLTSAALFSARARADAAATFDVTVRVTTPDDHPLAQQTLRIVLGTPVDWQSATSGQSFTTDQNGEVRFTAPGSLDRLRRKRPTNFFSSLVSLPESIDRLQVATELEYAGVRRLYVFPIERFVSDGTTMHGEYEVYSRNPSGNFSQRATRRDGGWLFPDLGGLALTNSGYEPVRLTFQPDTIDASGKRWTLIVWLRRLAEPVVR